MRCGVHSGLEGQPEAKEGEPVCCPCYPARHALTSTGAPTVLLSISPTRALVPFRLAILACTRSRMALMSVESRLVGAVWCGSAESPVLRKRPGPTTAKNATQNVVSASLSPRPPALDTMPPAVSDFPGVAGIFMVHAHPPGTSCRTHQSPRGAPGSARPYSQRPCSTPNVLERTSGRVQVLAA